MYQERELESGKAWPPTGWGGALSVETLLAAIWGQRRLGWGQVLRAFSPVLSSNPEIPILRKEESQAREPLHPLLKKDSVKHALNMLLLRP